MTNFGAVSAVRIHSWVARTPELRLTRGASEALKGATSRGRISPLLPVGVQWCSEAGEVSGVVPLQAPVAVDLMNAIDMVAHQIQSALPALELEAWWTEADDYVTAFDAWDAETVTGRRGPEIRRRTFLHQNLDVPIVESCAACRDEPADMSRPPVAPRDEAESPYRIGRDCGERLDSSDRRDALSSLGGRQARDFDELARSGGLGPDGLRVDTPVRRTKTNNHLATISADGNAVGGLMQALAHPGEGVSAEFLQGVAELRRHVVLVINGAGSEALRLATKGIGAVGQQVSPVAVHVHGGDDIVVSVPAPLAWRFVTNLLLTFDREVGSGLKGWTVGKLTEHSPGAHAEIDRIAAERLVKRMNQLSLGASIVFAHSSHPFADCLSMADKVLGEAKRATAGRASAVSWADITEHAAVYLGRHVTADQLAEQMDHPDAVPVVMGVSRSGQATLSQMLTDLWGDSSDDDDADSLARAIEDWAKRTKNPPLLPARSPLRPATAVALAGLRDDLSRARWWPTTKASS